MRPNGARRAGPNPTPVKTPGPGTAAKSPRANSSIGPVELEVVVGRGILWGDGQEADRRRELRRQRAEAAHQLTNDLCPPGRAAHRVECPGTVASDEADHQAGCALPGRSTAIARVDEVTGEDR